MLRSITNTSRLAGRLLHKSRRLRSRALLLVRNAAEAAVFLCGFTRFIAIVTTAALLLTGVCGQAIAALSDQRTNAALALREGLSGISIPSTLGRATEARWCGSDTIVINIQDLHCHAEAQRNISGLLGLLDREIGLKQVFVEGGIGPVDASWAGLIGDRKLRQNVVDSLVRRGRLTGAESYAITAGRADLLRGIEDEKVYAENFRRLGAILARKREIAGKLPAIRAEIQALTKKYFTRGNLRLDALADRRAAGELSAEKYYHLLLRAADSAGADPGAYPMLTGFEGLNKMQRGLNPGRVQRQMSELLGTIKQLVPYGTYRLLMEKAGDRGRIDELYAGLMKAVREYHLDIKGRYAELSRFFEYQEAARALNPAELIREERRLRSELRYRLSMSPAEQEVGFLADFFPHIESYLTNKLTADEYEYYVKHLGEFKGLWAKYELMEGMPQLAGYYDLFDRYYEANVERNRIFTEKILPLDARPGMARQTGTARTDQVSQVLGSLKKAKNVVVVVTGGFHTRGLSREFRTRGISYLVITPGITTDTAAADSLYGKIAAEQAGMLEAARQTERNAFALRLFCQQFGTNRQAAMNEAMKQFIADALSSDGRFEQLAAACDATGGRLRQIGCMTGGYEYHYRDGMLAGAERVVRFKVTRAGEKPAVEILEDQEAITLAGWTMAAAETLAYPALLQLQIIGPSIEALAGVAGILTLLHIFYRLFAGIASEARRRAVARAAGLDPASADGLEMQAVLEQDGAVRLHFYGNGTELTDIRSTPFTQQSYLAAQQTGLRAFAEAVIPALKRNGPRDLRDTVIWFALMGLFSLPVIAFHDQTWIVWFAAAAGVSLHGRYNTFVLDQRNTAGRFAWLPLSDITGSPAAPSAGPPARGFVLPGQDAIRVQVANPNDNYVRTSAGAVSAGISMSMRLLHPDAAAFPRVIIAPQGDWTGTDGSSLMQLYFAVAANFNIHKRRTIIVCRPDQRQRIIRYLQLGVPYEFPNRAGYPDAFMQRMWREAITLADRSVVDGAPRMTTPYPDMIEFADLDQDGNAAVNVDGRSAMRIAALPDGRFRVADTATGGQSVISGAGLRELEVRLRGAEPVDAIPEFGVTFLGTDDPMDDSGLSHSQIIWAGDQHILVDVNTPTLDSLRALDLSPADITHVMITHLHEPLVSGLLRYFAWCKTNRHPIRLVMEPGMYELLKEMARQVLDADLESVYGVELTPLPFDATRAFGAGERELQIECAPAFHGTPTLMLRFNYRGETISCAVNTAYDPRRYEAIMRGDLPPYVREDLRREGETAGLSVNNDVPVFAGPGDDGAGRVRQLESFAFRPNATGKTPAVIIHDCKGKDGDGINWLTNHTLPAALDALPEDLQRRVVYNNARPLAGRSGRAFRHAGPMSTAVVIPANPAGPQTARLMGDIVKGNSNALNAFQQLSRAGYFSPQRNGIARGEIRAVALLPGAAPDLAGAIFSLLIEGDPQEAAWLVRIAFDTTVPYPTRLAAQHALARANGGNIPEVVALLSHYLASGIGPGVFADTSIYLYRAGSIRSAGGNLYRAVFEDSPRTALRQRLLAKSAGTKIPRQITVEAEFLILSDGTIELSSVRGALPSDRPIAIQARSGLEKLTGAFNRGNLLSSAGDILPSAMEVRSAYHALIARGTVKWDADPAHDARAQEVERDGMRIWFHPVRAEYNKQPFERTGCPLCAHASAEEVHPALLGNIFPYLRTHLVFMLGHAGPGSTHLEPAYLEAAFRWLERLGPEFRGGQNWNGVGTSVAEHPHMHIFEEPLPIESLPVSPRGTDANGTSVGFVAGWPVDVWVLGSSDHALLRDSAARFANRLLDQGSSFNFFISLADDRVYVIPRRPGTNIGFMQNCGKVFAVQGSDLQNMSRQSWVNTIQAGGYVDGASRDMLQDLIFPEAGRTEGLREAPSRTAAGTDLSATIIVVALIGLLIVVPAIGLAIRSHPEIVRVAGYGGIAAGVGTAGYGLRGLAVPGDMPFGKAGQGTTWPGWIKNAVRFVLAVLAAPLVEAVPLIFRTSTLINRHGYTGWRKAFVGATIWGVKGVAVLLGAAAGPLYGFVPVLPEMTDFVSYAYIIAVVMTSVVIASIPLHYAALVILSFVDFLIWVFNGLFATHIPPLPLPAVRAVNATPSRRHEQSLAQPADRERYARDRETLRAAIADPGTMKVAVALLLEALHAQGRTTAAMIESARAGASSPNHRVLLLPLDEARNLRVKFELNDRDIAVTIIGDDADMLDALDAVHKDMAVLIMDLLLAAQAQPRDGSARDRQLYLDGRTDILSRMDELWRYTVSEMASIRQSMVSRARSYIGSDSIAMMTADNGRRVVTIEYRDGLTVEYAFTAEGISVSVVRGRFDYSITGTGFNDYAFYFIAPLLELFEQDLRAHDHLTPGGRGPGRTVASVFAALGIAFALSVQHVSADSGPANLTGPATAPGLDLSGIVSTPAGMIIAGLILAVVAALSVRAVVNARRARRASDRPGSLTAGRGERSFDEILVNLKAIAEAPSIQQKVVFIQLARAAYRMFPEKSQAAVGRSFTAALIAAEQGGIPAEIPFENLLQKVDQTGMLRQVMGVSRPMSGMRADAPLAIAVESPDQFTQRLQSGMNEIIARLERLRDESRSDSAHAGAVRGSAAPVAGLSLGLALSLMGIPSAHAAQDALSQGAAAPVGAGLLRSNILADPAVQAFAVLILLWVLGIVIAYGVDRLSGRKAVAGNGVISRRSFGIAALVFAAMLAVMNPRAALAALTAFVPTPGQDLVPLGTHGTWLSEQVDPDDHTGSSFWYEFMTPYNGIVFAGESYTRLELPDPINGLQNIMFSCLPVGADPNFPQQVLPYSAIVHVPGQPQLYPMTSGADGAGRFVEVNNIRVPVLEAIIENGRYCAYLPLPSGIRQGITVHTGIAAYGIPLNAQRAQITSLRSAVYAIAGDPYSPQSAPRNILAPPAQFGSWTDGSTETRFWWTAPGGLRLKGGRLSLQFGDLAVNNFILTLPPPGVNMQGGSAGNTQDLLPYSFYVHVRGSDRPAGYTVDPVTHRPYVLVGGIPVPYVEVTLKGAGYALDLPLRYGLAGGILFHNGSQALDMPLFGPNGATLAVNSVSAHLLQVFLPLATTSTAAAAPALPAGYLSGVFNNTHALTGTEGFIIDANTSVYMLDSNGSRRYLRRVTGQSVQGRPELAEERALLYSDRNAAVAGDDSFIDAQFMYSSAAGAVPQAYRDAVMARAQDLRQRYGRDVWVEADQIAPFDLAASGQYRMAVQRAAHASSDVFIPRVSFFPSTTAAPSFADLPGWTYQATVQIVNDETITGSKWLKAEYGAGAYWGIPVPQGLSDFQAYRNDPAQHGLRLTLLGDDPQLDIILEDDNGQPVGREIHLRLDLLGADVLEQLTWDNQSIVIPFENIIAAAPAGFNWAKVHQIKFGSGAGTGHTMLITDLEIIEYSARKIAYGTGGHNEHNYDNEPLKSYTNADRVAPYLSVDGGSRAAGIWTGFSALGQPIGETQEGVARGDSYSDIKDRAALARVHKGIPRIALEFRFWGHITGDQQKVHAERTRFNAVNAGGITYDEFVGRYQNSARVLALVNAGRVSPVQVVEAVQAGKLPASLIADMLASVRMNDGQRDEVIAAAGLSADAAPRFNVASAAAVPSGAAAAANVLDAVTGGELDPYLRHLARELRGSAPLYLRVFHEPYFWFPWGMTQPGDVAKFKLAWEHVGRIFEEEGANNVMFVMTFDPFRPAGFTETAAIPSRYLAAIEIDGYGREGQNAEKSGGAIFGRKLDEIYKQLRLIYPDPAQRPPIGMGEFAFHGLASPAARTKPERFAQFFSGIAHRAFAGLSEVVAFHADGITTRTPPWEGDGTHGWVVDWCMDAATRARVYEILAGQGPAVHADGDAYMQDVRSGSRTLFKVQTAQTLAAEHAAAQTARARSGRPVILASSPVIGFALLAAVLLSGPQGPQSVAASMQAAQDILRGLGLALGAACLLAGIVCAVIAFVLVFLRGETSLSNAGLTLVVFGGLGALGFFAAYEFAGKMLIGEFIARFGDQIVHAGLVIGAAVLAAVILAALLRHPGSDDPYAGYGAYLMREQMKEEWGQTLRDLKARIGDLWRSLMRPTGPGAWWDESSFTGATGRSFGRLWRQTLGPVLEIPLSLAGAAALLSHLAPIAGPNVLAVVAGAIFFVPHVLRFGADAFTRPELAMLTLGTALSAAAFSQWGLPSAVLALSLVNILHWLNNNWHDLFRAGPGSRSIPLGMTALSSVLAFSVFGHGLNSVAPGMLALQVFSLTMAAVIFLPSITGYAGISQRLSGPLNSKSLDLVIQENTLPVVVDLEADARVLETAGPQGRNIEVALRSPADLSDAQRLFMVVDLTARPDSADGERFTPILVIDDGSEGGREIACDPVAVANGSVQIDADLAGRASAGPFPLRAIVLRPQGAWQGEIVPSDAVMVRVLKKLAPSAAAVPEEIPAPRPAVREDARSVERVETRGSETVIHFNNAIDIAGALRLEFMIEPFSRTAGAGLIDGTRFTVGLIQGNNAVIPLEQVFTVANGRAMVGLDMAGVGLVGIPVRGIIIKPVAGTVDGMRPEYFSDVRVFFPDRSGALSADSESPQGTSAEAMIQRWIKGRSWAALVPDEIDDSFAEQVSPDSHMVAQFQYYEQDRPRVALLRDSGGDLLLVCGGTSYVIPGDIDSDAAAEIIEAALWLMDAGNYPEYVASYVTDSGKIASWADPNNLFKPGTVYPLRDAIFQEYLMQLRVIFATFSAEPVNRYDRLNERGRAAWDRLPGLLQRWFARAQHVAVDDPYAAGEFTRRFMYPKYEAREIVRMVLYRIFSRHRMYPKARAVFMFSHLDSQGRVSWTTRMDQALDRILDRTETVLRAGVPIAISAALLVVPEALRSAIPVVLAPLSLIVPAVMLIGAVYAAAYATHVQANIRALPGEALAQSTGRQRPRRFSEAVQVHLGMGISGELLHVKEGTAHTRSGKGIAVRVQGIQVDAQGANRHAQPVYVASVELTVLSKKNPRTIVMQDHFAFFDRDRKDMKRALEAFHAYLLRIIGESPDIDSALSKLVSIRGTELRDDQYILSEVVPTGASEGGRFEGQTARVTAMMPGRTVVLTADGINVMNPGNQPLLQAVFALHNFIIRQFENNIPLGIIMDFLGSGQQAGRVASGRRIELMLDGLLDNAGDPGAQHRVLQSASVDLKSFAARAGRALGMIALMIAVSAVLSLFSPGTANAEALSLAAVQASAPAAAPALGDLAARVLLAVTRGSSTMLVLGSVLVYAGITVSTRVTILDAFYLLMMAISHNFGLGLASPAAIAGAVSTLALVHAGGVLIDIEFFRGWKADGARRRMKGAVIAAGVVWSISELVRLLTGPAGYSLTVFITLAWIAAAAAGIINARGAGRDHREFERSIVNEVTARVRQLVPLAPEFTGAARLRRIILGAVHRFSRSSRPLAGFAPLLANTLHGRVCSANDPGAIQEAINRADLLGEDIVVAMPRGREWLAGSVRPISLNLRVDEQGAIGRTGGPLNVRTLQARTRRGSVTIIEFDCPAPAARAGYELLQVLAGNAPALRAANTHLAPGIERRGFGLLELDEEPAAGQPLVFDRNGGRFGHAAPVFVLRADGSPARGQFDAVLGRDPDTRMVADRIIEFNGIAERKNTRFMKAFPAGVRIEELEHRGQLRRLDDRRLQEIAVQGADTLFIRGGLLDDPKAHAELARIRTRLHGLGMRLAVDLTLTGDGAGWQDRAAARIGRAIGADCLVLDASRMNNAAAAGIVSALAEIAGSPESGVIMAAALPPGYEAALPEGISPYRLVDVAQSGAGVPLVPGTWVELAVEQDSEQDLAALTAFLNSDQLNGQVSAVAFDGALLDNAITGSQSSTPDDLFAAFFSAIGKRADVFNAATPRRQYALGRRDALRRPLSADIGMADLRIWMSGYFAARRANTEPAQAPSMDYGRENPTVHFSAGYIMGLLELAEGSMVTAGDGEGSAAQLAPEARRQYLFVRARARILAADYEQLPAEYAAGSADIRLREVPYYAAFTVDRSGWMSQARPAGVRPEYLEHMMRSSDRLLDMQKAGAQALRMETAARENIDRLNALLERGLPPETERLVLAEMLAVLQLFGERRMDGMLVDRLAQQALDALPAATRAFQGAA